MAVPWTSNIFCPLEHSLKPIMFDVFADSELARPSENAHTPREAYAPLDITGGDNLNYDFSKSTLSASS